MNLLHTIGLMTRVEHEAASFRVQCQAAEALTEIENLKAELRAADNLASGWEAKYKQAVADLEKQAGEIESLTIGNALLTNKVESLRPDALAMRKKRAADRKRMAGKRGKGQ